MQVITKAMKLWKVLACNEEVGFTIINNRNIFLKKNNILLSYLL